MIVTTRAVLLRAYPYGESSLVLRFLTADLGTVGAMARGVRRGGGKGRSPPATFDRGTLEISFRESRDLQGWRGFTVTGSGRGLGTDLARFAGASLLAELVLAAPAQEPSPELHETVVRSLNRLEETAKPSVPAELLAAAWGVVRTLGFTPSVRECVVCAGAIEAQGMARFDPVAGGLRCPVCASEAAGPRVGPEARRELLALVEGRVPETLRRASGQLRVLEEFVSTHLELRRPLRSVGMLRPLLRTGAPAAPPARDPGPSGPQEAT